jgi:hypothetical protein
MVTAAVTIVTPAGSTQSRNRRIARRGLSSRRGDSRAQMHQLKTDVWVLEA